MISADRERRKVLKNNDGKYLTIQVSLTLFRIWITCPPLPQRKKQLSDRSRRLHSMGHRQNDLQTRSWRDDCSVVHLKQEMLLKCKVLRQPKTRPKRHHRLLPHSTKILQRTNHNHVRWPRFNFLLYKRRQCLSLQRNKVPKKANKRWLLRLAIPLLQHHAPIHHKSWLRCSLSSPRSRHPQ